MKYGMILNGYEILGDHRPQYLDINIKEILQMNSLDLGSQSSRRLRSTDVKAVKSYCENVHSHFKNHKIYDRMERLYEETKNQVIMTSEQIEKYEALDRDVYRLCTNAEKTIKLFPFTKYVWSPALDDAVGEVQYWKMRKKHLSNKKKTQELVTSGKSKGIDDTEKNKAHNIEDYLTQAYKSLHQVQRNDYVKRQEYLNDLAEKYAQENNLTKEQAIRELMSHEELRDMFRTIRLRMGGAISPPLSKVWIKGENDEDNMIIKSVSY